jgi:hypothetical protein
MDPHIQKKVVALLAKNAVLLDVGSLEIISSTCTFSLFVVNDLSQWARLWELALVLASTVDSDMDIKGTKKRKNVTEITNDDRKNVDKKKKKSSKNLPAKSMHLFDPGQIQHSLRELANKITSTSLLRPEKKYDLEETTKPVYNLFSDLIVHSTVEPPCIPVLQYDSALLHRVYQRHTL